MVLGHRSARRRGMVVGAAVASSRANKKVANTATSQTAAASAAQTVQQEDYVEQLKKLGELRDSGILTEDEFTAKKKQILGF